MKEFQEKRKRKKIIFSVHAIILLSAAIVFLFGSTVKVYKKSREAVFLNNEIKKELAELEIRKSELEAAVARLQTESGIEEEARKKFNVRKPGEKVLVIVDKETETGKLDSNEKLRGFFSRIWQSVKSVF